MNGINRIRFEPFLFVFNSILRIIMKPTISDIGLNAGRIWNELAQRSFEFSIQELCWKLSMTFEEAALAIGWLARENNIVINKKDGRIMLLHK